MIVKSIIRFTLNKQLHTTISSIEFGKSIVETSEIIKNEIFLCNPYDTHYSHAARVYSNNKIIKLKMTQSVLFASDNRTTSTIIYLGNACHVRITFFL